MMDNETTAPGPLALVALRIPATDDRDRSGLLAGRPARYVQLATAAVPDGPSVVERWHNLGIEQAKRLDVEAVIVPVSDRADATTRRSPRWFRRRLIYLSGGNPRTSPTPFETPPSGRRSSPRGAPARRSRDAAPARWR